MSEEIFPPSISYRSVIEPMYDTRIVTLANGYEQRNAKAIYAKRKFLIPTVFQTKAERETFLNFFHSLGGAYDTFRISDWSDYLTTQSTGVLGTSTTGTGLPTYQLNKRYTYGSLFRDRKLIKILSTTVYRNASPVTAGAGAGQVSIALNTGVVTFVADSSSSATSHAVGATHQVTLTAALSGLIVGGKLYLDGVTGTAATLLNNLAHTINNIATNTYTLAVNTNGLTASSGTGRKYPQPTDTLSHVSEFHVPVRFEVDGAPYHNESINISAANELRLIEVLNP